MTDSNPDPRITRRGILAAGGAALLGAAGGVVIGRASASEPDAPTAMPTAASTSEAVASGEATLLPFYDDHQAGVETEEADFQTFLGLDLRNASRDDADAVLRLVSDDAARLTQGQPILGDAMPELAANADLMSIAVGLGHGFFRKAGLEHAIPAEFVEIPAFENDTFEDPWTQTDLVLQIGANDPTALSHAVRMLTRDLSTLADVRWQQDGFRAPGTMDLGTHARRNLMGWPEGKHFPVPGTQDFADVVWIQEGPDWLVGGTILVLRRMRMELDLWDRLDRSAQETVVGRRLSDGELLSADAPGDPFEAVDDLGLPVIPMDAHVRIARADSLDGVILRRPYNYDMGIVDGRNDVGLVFATYQRDPAKQFIATQARLTKSDAFRKWITAIGSATYVFPAGAKDGGYIGEGLFT